MESVVYLLKEAIDDQDGTRISPLYSSLPRPAQLKVFEPLPPRVRRIIVSTNIAEASVTLPNVKFVVDCGLSKQSFFDLESGGGVDSLVLSPISQASAIQRAGRAGRTGPGKCFRLYTEECYEQDLRKFQIPEMQRSNLSWPILHLKALGIHDVAHFDFISPPSAEMVMFALELLYCLGAIDEEGIITPIVGEAMAIMPLEPKLSRALISSWDFGCVEEMLSIAAMLSVNHPYNIPTAKGSTKRRVHETASLFASNEGDHISLLNIYRECTENDFDHTWFTEVGVDKRVLDRAGEIRSHLEKQVVSFRTRVLSMRRAEEEKEKGEEEEEKEDGKRRRVDESQLPQIQSFGRYQDGDSDNTHDEKAQDDIFRSKMEEEEVEEVIPSVGEDYHTILRCLVTGFFSNAGSIPCSIPTLSLFMVSSHGE